MVIPAQPNNSTYHDGILDVAAYVNDPCGTLGTCNLTLTGSLGSSVTVTLPPAGYRTNGSFGSGLAGTAREARAARPVGSPGMLCLERQIKARGPVNYYPLCPRHPRAADPARSSPSPDRRRTVSRPGSVKGCPALRLLPEWTE